MKNKFHKIIKHISTPLFNIIKVTLFLILLTIANISIAQEGYTDGYYIPLGGDSVITKIKILNGKANKKIGYISPKGKKRKFDAEEVSEYGLKGLSSYASVAPSPKTPKVRLFAEIIEEGQVRLMYYASKKKYFIKSKNKAEATTVKKMGFRKQAMALFHDFDELYIDIKKRKVKYQQLETIVARYNAWHQD